VAVTKFQSNGKWRHVKWYVASIVWENMIICLFTITFSPEDRGYRLLQNLLFFVSKIRFLLPESPTVIQSFTSNISNSQPPVFFCGPGSSVGLATGYALDGPGIESRWVARLFAPVHTGPGAHPASCTIGIRFFPGVKSGWGVTLIPLPLLVPLVMKE
jgi:hypothetical protein